MNMNMNNMASEGVVEDPLLAYAAGFDDVRGWYHAYSGANGQYRWRTCREKPKRPRLYYPAGLQYHPGHEYFAIDGMGRTKTGNQPFECTINPYTGKLERLCVQAQDSLCSYRNSTWDRTVVRSSAPGILRVSLFPRRGIHKSRKWNPQQWDEADWWSVVWRWIPASLGIGLILILPGAEKPRGKNPHAYLPFRYNGYRYPRMARNFWENRREIHALHPIGSSSAADMAVRTYRAFRPRYLCYLMDKSVTDQNGHKVTMRFIETRPVRQGDYTPYVFISYTKDQFTANGDNFQMLFAWAIAATDFYADSLDDNSRKPGAFWIDSECQPLKTFDEKSGQETAVLDETAKELVDHDVYTMSDIIRGAEHTIVLTRGPGVETQNAVDKARSLIEWGDRVWTLPEVVLSKGTTVTLVQDGNCPQEIPKVRLAELAWRDAGAARQLVEHFTNLHLSRLELVSISLKCLQGRTIRSKYKGDRSYALMGLLRVRPLIDSDDSSFQAFARLSLPQDNDRLMERLICLLPNRPDEPWHTMSDVFHSSLWDIYPDTQVCGVGENDTIIVDGFKGALIQWSMFHTVKTVNRATSLRGIIIIVTLIAPLLLFFAILLLSITREGLQVAGGIFLAIALLILLQAPLSIPRLYDGKLYEVEPCLFGVEGYVPLPELEETLFGLRLGRLKWSSFGSPLSRHEHRSRCKERAGQRRDIVDDEPLSSTTGRDQNSDECIWTYPVEAIDPCSACEHCQFSAGEWRCAHHETIPSVQEKSRSDYGEMKIFMLIDTFSMTVTLFESPRPPVALIIGGSEGGMKRALACSYDVTTGILYRETVLRLPSQTVDKMFSLPRVRLGLKSPYNASDVIASTPGTSHEAPQPNGVARPHVYIPGPSSQPRPTHHQR